MKPFKFRLASFLQIKEFEEKNSWNEVLKQEARMSGLKNKIDQILHSMEENRQSRNRTGTEGMTQSQAVLIEESLLGQAARVEQLRQEYQGELKTLMKLQEIHAEKKREAKVLEKFKDKKKQDFKVLADKEEQNRTNEVASNIFARRDKKHG